MQVRRSEPPHTSTGSKARHPAEDPNSERPETDWPSLVPTTARRLAKTYAHMFPENASAAAFVRWRQMIGETGRVAQEALYDEYLAICELADFQALPLRTFGRELEMAGCQRKQEDRRRNGKGPRPKVVTVPSMPSTANRVPMRDFRHLKVA